MRAPPRLVWRATTASGRPSRTTGTASSRTAYDPNQRGSRERWGRSSVERGLELRALPLGRAGPDDVVVVDGRAGARAALRDRDEVARAGGQPQHEVGEGEVGDDLPVPDQQVQPLDVGGVEIGVAGDQVAQRGHRDSLGGSPAPPARALTSTGRGRTRPGPTDPARPEVAVHVRVQLRYDRRRRPPSPRCSPTPGTSGRASRRAGRRSSSSGRHRRPRTAPSPSRPAAPCRRSGIPAQARSFVGSTGSRSGRSRRGRPPRPTARAAGTVVVEISGAPVRLTGRSPSRPTAGGTRAHVRRRPQGHRCPCSASAVEQAAAGAVRSALEAEQARVAGSPSMAARGLRRALFGADGRRQEPQP